ncbi:MAG: polymer-forming cytoskeletal protein [Desulfobulbaceae bacterium]|nr:polymer-forming cytoskeletal protein [Desulfobulbaceae bacterium]
MAIFNKKDALEQEAGRVSKEAISCLISKEMHISGEITFKGKARVDGTIEGNIQGEYLVLSKTGRVNGDLELDALICHGTIEGNIQAKLVTAHATATIRGRLTAGSLTVEPGAVLEGEIHASSKKAGSSEHKKSLSGTVAKKEQKENKKTTN